jgi:hypothetical protein
MVQAGAARGASNSPGLGTDYRRLWAASTISNLGDGVRLAAAAGLRAPYLLAGGVLLAMAAVMAGDARFRALPGPGGAAGR